MEIEMDSVHREDSWTNTAQNSAHTFYFVKYQKYRNPSIMRKIEDTTLDIQSMSKEIRDLDDKLKRISEKQDYRLQRAKCYKQWAESTKEELVLMKKFIDKKLRKMDMRVHSPDEEQLYDHMSVLKHDLRNKRLTSNEEKRLMKEMKELQVEMNKAKADDSSKLKEDQEREKRHLESIIRIINWRRPKKLSMKECYELLKDQHQKELDELTEWREAIMKWDREIKLIQDEINAKSSKVAWLNRMLIKYQKMEDDANASYYQNVELLSRAKDLAVKKDIAALEKLLNQEIEKSFTHWRENEAFKKDYERKVLASLKSRGFNKDGTSDS